MKEYTNKLEVLFIEDHDIIIDAYLLVLETFFKETEIVHYRCNDCKKTYYFLKEEKYNIDIVFLDYSLPAYSSQKINNGLDLLPHLKASCPKAYILFLTSYNFAFLIYEIYQNHGINAIISKNDLNTSTLLNILEKILKYESYYSAEVIHLIEKIKQHPIFMDKMNRDIIHLISENRKGEEISRLLPISLSGLNKRKMRIKKALPLPVDAKDYDVLKYCIIQNLL